MGEREPELIVLGGVQVQTTRSGLTRCAGRGMIEPPYDDVTLGFRYVRGP